MALAQVLGDEAGRKPFEGREVEAGGDVAGHAAQRVRHGPPLGEEALVGGVVPRSRASLALSGHRPVFLETGRGRRVGLLCSGRRLFDGCRRMAVDGGANEWLDGTDSQPPA